jgi:hypothetical protein
MTDSNFLIDLEKFQLAEKKVAEFFEKEFKTKTISLNHDNKHDFKCLYNNHRELKVEVKGDRWCYPDKIVNYSFGPKLEKGRDSGNLFIETECRGKLSGINTSKSDYYAYYYVYFKKLWLIRTSDLKKLILENDFEIKDENVGDKGSKTKGYVIPRDEFIEHFRVYDIDFEWPY